MSDRPAPVLHRADPGVTIWHGHSLDVLRAMPSESVHAVVCDPPYGLSNTDTRHVLDTITRWIGGEREFVPDTGGGFMGNRWDDFVPPPAIWDECLRVLKPGGHMIAFAGSRTYDLMGLSIRLAGFEIRDGLAWLYSQGFPKSMNVGKDRQFCQCSPVPYSHARDADLPGVRGHLLSPSEDGATGSEPDVLAAMQRQGAGPGMGEGRTQRARGTDSRVVPISVREDDRPAQPSVEGRRDGATSEGELHSVADSSVSAVAGEHDAREWAHSAAPSRHGGVGRPTADESGVRESHRSRHDEQHPVESGVVADEPGSQVGRGWPTCRDCGKPQVVGLGTALKPAFEPMVLARKPLTGTVAANVLQHGTGGLNLDSTRISTTDSLGGGAQAGAGLATKSDGWARPWMKDEGTVAAHAARVSDNVKKAESLGRHPANVLLDESQAAELDRQSGTLTSGLMKARTNREPRKGGTIYGADQRNIVAGDTYGDTGGASRFFYVAKAPTNERPTYLDEDGKRHAHPTVKPLDLIRWIIRLITPPGGTVVDPFLGSGTTAEAAVVDGFDFIGSELEAKYLPLIDTRLDRGDPTSALESTLTTGTPKADHGRLF